MNGRSRSLKLTVLGILGIPILIFGVQNWGTSVAVVFLGQPLFALPLSISMLAAYGLGGGIGMLLLGSWRFHDRVILRQSQKSLDLLNGRLMQLERSRYRPNYSLPDQAQGTPLGGYSSATSAAGARTDDEAGYTKEPGSDSARSYSSDSYSSSPYSSGYEPRDPSGYGDSYDSDPYAQEPDPDSEYLDPRDRPNWQWYGGSPASEDPDDDDAES